MSDDTISPTFLLDAMLFRLRVDGTITAPQLADVLAACSSQFIDADGRERLRRAARRWLNELARQGALVRNEHGGRNGAHEYVPVRRRALSLV